MTTVLTAVCPECQTIYRIDPSRVPSGGLRARCSACGAVIAIGLAMPSVVSVAASADPAVLAASDAAAAPIGAEVWDWGTKAQSAGAPSVPQRASDDPWAGIWGVGGATGPTPAALPGSADATRTPADTRPLPPAIARRPRP